MFILASASPRRKELLSQMDYSFEVKVSDADEIMVDTSEPSELVMENACAKAAAVAKQNPGVPVLGADTVVSVDGHVLGKPKDADDAARMLSMLSGRSHQVSTGIAFVCQADGECHVCKEAVVTDVTFGEMTSDDISWYVSTGEPLDKAGAYGIQGRAAAFIKGIEGSYSNVVGLPLFAVRQLAKKAGVDLYDNGAGASTR